MKDHNPEDNIKFDAYAYAHDFEKLSLEIVKIVTKERFNESDVKYADTTKATKDYGVDAYIIIDIHGEYSTYTVEAKLRTTEILSLRDFATSILYYIINTSSKHFIVTNVTYSVEAQRYIEQLNATQNKLVALIDGKILQDTINQNLKVFHDYPPKLLHYLRSRTYIPQNTIEISLFEKRSENNIIPLKCYEELITSAEIRYKTGINVFMVTGMKETGKSTWIEYYTQQKLQGYTIYKLDLAIIQTPRLLVVELLHLLLGFDIEKLIRELENDEHTLIDYIEANQKFHTDKEEIIDALKVLLIGREHNIETHIYAMKILIKHLYKTFLIHSNIVLIIDNLHEASFEMIKFTIDAMYCFGAQNSIIIWEILLPSSAGQLTNITIEQWNNALQALENRKNEKRQKAYRIVMPTSLDESIPEIIKNIIPDINFTDEFIEKFADYFGANIKTVLDALLYIKQKKSYSIISLDKIYFSLPIFIEHQICELIDTHNENSTFFNWVFQFCKLLDGKLDTPIIEFLDKKFNVNTWTLLMKSGLFWKKKGNINI